MLSASKQDDAVSAYKSSSGQLMHIIWHRYAKVNDVYGRMDGLIVVKSIHNTKKHLVLELFI